jgi:cytochrome c oxidase cbb3-type subunit III
MPASFVEKSPDETAVSGRDWSRLICLVSTLLMASFTAYGQGRGGQAEQPPTSAPPAVQQVARNPVVDKTAEEQGKALWSANCITCHGTQARGSDSAPNLIRSEVVSYDRGAEVAGTVLGPFLKKGHPTQSGKPSDSFTDAEIFALANFLREQVNETMRGSPTYIVLPQNLLTGNPKTGEADFTELGCTNCHNDTSRSLNGIASRINNPQTLQAMVLYPVGGRGFGGGRGRGGRGAVAAPVTEPTGPKPPDPLASTIKIIPTSGAAISGWLVDQDAFFITYSDAAGVQYTIRKTPGMKIETTNPLQWHVNFANRLTDDEMHDLTAYLWSLK